MSNPYSPPNQPSARPAPAGPPSPYAPCPRCGARESKIMGFTWWGGLLGPKMLSHVQCPRCRYQYNGKSGQSNNTAIAIYIAVGVAIGLMIGLAIGVLPLFR